MSYQKRDTKNALNNYFTRLRDFYMLAPKLLGAENLRSFEIWLDKLIQIDRRSLVLYLRKHKDEIPKAHWKRAKARLYRWLGEDNHVDTAGI